MAISTGLRQFLCQFDRMVGSRGNSVADQPLAPGDVAKARLPVGAEEISMLYPSGKGIPIVEKDPSNISYGPLRSSGMYTMSWKGSQREK